MPKPKTQVAPKAEPEDLIYNYEKKFGETLNVPNDAKGRELLLKINQTEPDYPQIAAGISGRMHELVESRQFRNALAGFEVPEDEIREEAGKIMKRELQPGQAKALEKADRLIAKLKFCLQGLGDTYISGTGRRTRGMRMLFQLPTLLKQTVREGENVYGILKSVARQIPGDPAERSEWKAAQAGKKPQGEMDGPDLLIREEPELERSKSMLPDLYTDLYYLDETLGLGTDMPHLDPESVVKEPNLSLVHTWQDYYRTQCEQLPHSPAARRDRLANVLVGAFQAGRESANGILPTNPPEPYSPKLAKDYAKQLREKPLFRKLCKDPQRVKDLLTVDPKRPNKQFNAMLYMFRPFGNVKPEKGREILLALKNMLPVMDPPQGRSKEWRALYESIQSIDPLKLPEDPEKKLQEIYDRNNAYMKGKKSLRKNQELQNRFDQCLDVLSVLAGSGPYAKLAAEAVVDRINEVRIGHNSKYKTIQLEAFGKDQIKKHNNHPVIAKGLDVLPEDLKLLPVFQKRNPNDPDAENKFCPLQEYTGFITPLYSDNDVSQVELQSAIATAVVLSKKQLYYFHGSSEHEAMNKTMAKYGRVVFSGDPTSEIFKLSQSPEVRRLAEKYSKPEARAELRRQVGLQEPEQVPQLIQPMPPKKQVRLEIPEKAPKKVGFALPEEDQKLPPKKQIKLEIPEKAPKKVGFALPEEDQKLPPKKQVKLEMPDQAPKQGKKPRGKMKVSFADQTEVFRFQKPRWNDIYNPETDADLQDLPDGKPHPLLAPGKSIAEGLKNPIRQKPSEFDPSKLNAAKLLEDYDAVKREIEAEKAQMNKAGNVKK